MQALLRKRQKVLHYHRIWKTQKNSIQTCFKIHKICMCRLFQKSRTKVAKMTWYLLESRIKASSQSSYSFTRSCKTCLKINSLANNRTITSAYKLYNVLSVSNETLKKTTLLRVWLPRLKSSKNSFRFQLPMLNSRVSSARMPNENLLKSHLI